MRDSAREVIKRMGIFDRIRAASSNEEGFEIVDRNNRALAKFGVDHESGKGESVTCDIEILRGELSGILYDVTNQHTRDESGKGVKYIFGEWVEGLDERDDEVRVTFANGLPAATFDVVVAADGIGSRIRRVMISSGQGQENGKGVTSTGSASSAGGVDDPSIPLPPLLRNLLLHPARPRPG